MQKSSLQFKNPKLVGVELRLNQEFKNIDDGPVDIKVGFDINVNKLPDSSEAIVELTVVVGTEDSTNPFYIKATEGAMFRWEKDVKDVDILLQQNAPAILLGYLRSVIAMLTAVSPYAAYNLPVIDFTKTK
ncbi:MAG: protein-export chaperone SecB [Eubacteriales bacterium]|nr:protein-export chaperone SecB [Eubacteriales bacterium]